MTVADIYVRDVAQLTDLIPPLWLRKVRGDANQEEFFNAYEGPEGSRSAVIAKDQFRTEPGNELKITVESELYSVGRTGTNVLVGKEERPKTNQFGIPIVQYRHAEGITALGNKEAMVDEITRAAPRLGRWVGKKRDDIAFAELFSPAAATAKTIFAGDATQTSELTTSCRFSLDLINRCKLAMLRKGTLPLEISDSKTGEKLKMFACIIDEMSAYHMFTSTAFKAAVEAMLPRSFNHPLITGALGIWNNVLIRGYDSINQGCHQGTPLRPECSSLAGTSTHDNTSGRAFLIVGTEDDRRDYTKNFPSAGYVYINVAGTQTQIQYDSILEDSDGNGYGFTLTGTLAATYADGCVVTDYMNRARLIFHGAEMLGRAWGMRDTPIADVQDYGEKLGVGIKGIWGNRVIEDSGGGVPNYVIAEVYSDTPNYQV